MNIKKIVVAGLIMGTMVVGAGAASAQQPGVDPSQGGPRLRERDRIVMEIMAAQTGLDVREMIAQLRDGATLSELITANGGDVDAAIAEVVAQVTEQINTAVSESRLTQEQADELIANLEQNITDLVNGALLPEEGRPGGRGEHGRGRQGGEERALFGAIAEATGLPQDEVMAQLREGKTIAEILTENGTDVTAFVDQAMVEIETRLNEAVAAGRLTEAELAERLATMRERLEERLNNPLPRPGANPRGQNGI